MSRGEAPYYESRFVRANAPDQAKAVWLRETLLLPAVGQPGADVWVMVFDPRCGEPRPEAVHPIDAADFGR